MIFQNTNGDWIPVFCSNRVPVVIAVELREALCELRYAPAVERRRMQVGGRRLEFMATRALCRNFPDNRTAGDEAWTKRSAPLGASSIQGAGDTHTVYFAV
jgi:hypothetical protein